MLNVEQPHADRGGEQQHRQMDQQKRLDADEPHQRHGDGRDRGVGRHRAEPRPPAVAHQSDRQAVLQNEHVGRAHAEHHHRMAVKPIDQPLPSRLGQIFAHRQRVDVADAAAVEIAGARVMDRMGAPPGVVRRQGQDADHPPGPVVHEAVAEKGAVAAVVLNHEKPHQKAGGRNGQQKAQPVTEF